MPSPFGSTLLVSIRQSKRLELALHRFISGRINPFRCWSIPYVQTLKTLHWTFPRGLNTQESSSRMHEPDPSASDPANDEPRRRSLPRRLINRMEIDRAVFYAISQRVWQVLAGPVSMLVITQFFTEDMQGYFYAFASLMALQAFFELGLHAVVVPLVSHEFVHLKLTDEGRLVGDEAAMARLASIYRLLARWYGGVAILFVIGVGLFGLVYFWPLANGIDWVGPWCALVILTGLVLWTCAMTTILEGCNQMSAVNSLRLAQGISGNAFVWTSMATGLGLWSAAIAVAVRLVGDVWILGVRYRRLFESLQETESSQSVCWKTEILPLQWRMGLRGVFGFLAYSVFTLIAFKYQDPAAGGRIGMTWTALNALEQASFAWIAARGPLFGMLVARRDFRELDRVFFRLLWISLGMILAGGALFCAALFVLPQLPFPICQKIANRLLDWQTVAIFCAGLAGLHVLRSLGTYMLAHKKDPLLLVALVSCTVTALLVWLTGREGGAFSMAVSYAGVVLALNLPWTVFVWRRCRKEWHSSDSAALASTLNSNEDSG
jgi:hypothetical protein